MKYIYNLILENKFQFIYELKKNRNINFYVKQKLYHLFIRLDIKLKIKSI